MSESPPANLLRTLPPEIREIIYPHVLTLPEPNRNNRRSRGTPAFIVALRPDATLYPEVLQFYYFSNTFVLTPGTNRTFLGLKTPAVGHIRSLLIDLSSGHWHAHLLNKFLDVILRPFTNLERVEVSDDGGCYCTDFPAPNPQLDKTMALFRTLSEYEKILNIKMLVPWQDCACGVKFASRFRRLERQGLIASVEKEVPADTLQQTLYSLVRWKTKGKGVTVRTKG